MQNTYAKKGVLLLALSDEPGPTVKPFIKKNAMNYVVASDAKDTFSKYGIKGYPTIFVLDPTGKVTWSGHSGTEAENAVKKALKETPPTKKDWFVGERAVAAMEKADGLYKSKKYTRALTAYTKVTKDFKGTKQADEAKAKADKMKSDKEIALAMQKEAEERKAKLAPPRSDG